MLDVFLVEDSPAIMERLAEFLAPLPGVRIVGRAAGADEAIHGIAESHPDVVLLDIHLAQGSGFDVLQAVRSQSPDIDVYMLSNLAGEQYRRRSARLGAAEFFDKGCDLPQLRGVLESRAQGLAALVTL